MENFTEIIIAGGGIILVIAIAFLITKLASFWNAKSDLILNDIMNNEHFRDMEWVEYLLKKVIGVVDNVVSALDDTYKKDLLAAVEDGKLTDEEKKMLRDKAVELITEELPEYIWAQISDVVGDATEYIKTLIENAVSAHKKGTTALAEYIKNNKE